MKFYIIILVIIYILLCLSKLDELDRKAFYYYVKNISNTKSQYPLKTPFIFLYKTLLLPFREKTYYAKYTEGGIYGSYLYEFYPKLRVKMNNKLYWANIFKKYNINHPDLICYKKNGKLISIKQFQERKIYIVKPINGWLGYKINAISGKDIIEYSKKNNNFLVQEKLFDCIYGKARHFRLLTLYNGDIFSLWMMKQKDKKKIASNGVNGGKVEYCEDFNCNLTHRAQLELDEITNKLQKLHKELYYNVITIGWDIMINCDNINNIDCYCLEGNIMPSVWPGGEKGLSKLPQDKQNKMIYDYKKIVKKFYAENNI